MLNPALRVAPGRWAEPRTSSNGRGLLWATLGARATLAACPDDPAAAVAAACPCDADAGGQAWKNHGRYVSCVVRFRNDLRRAGCLDAATQRTIARCAARSTCGKAGFVLCCHYDTSATCSDPVADGVAAGTCSNDATKACDTATDCVTVGAPKLTRSADLCALRGGTSIGGGSVCAGCPLPPPAP
jgi:hypothetical protein